MVGILLQHVDLGVGLALVHHCVGLDLAGLEAVVCLDIWLGVGSRHLPPPRGCPGCVHG